MDKLQRLINPNVYSVADLESMGWENGDIWDYCSARSRKWRIGTEIFRKMFSSLGSIYVLKEFDEQRQTMRVTIYKNNDLFNHDIIAQQHHGDPLFALAECAKSLNKEDDFLSALLTGLTI